MLTPLNTFVTITFIKLLMHYWMRAAVQLRPSLCDAKGIREDRNQGRVEG